MSVKRWLRFPLALLAYKPEDPSANLDAILDYCIHSVGGSSAADEIDEREAYDYAEKKGIEHWEADDHLRVIRGAKILGITGGNCNHIIAHFQAVEGWIPAGSASKNMVNMDYGLFWRAVYTARGQDDEQELTWRDFRFLCALLSKVGSRKFDRCGWQEIQARAAGWCGKFDMRAATVQECARRAPLILTENQIPSTRAELEACNFFCRVKYRTGGGGNGGKSWYSFSTGKGGEGRAELLGWITQKKSRMRVGLADNRAHDTALIARTPSLYQVLTK